jgi:hypothetical protein
MRAKRYGAKREHLNSIIQKKRYFYEARSIPFFGPFKDGSGVASSKVPFKTVSSFFV